MIINGKINYQEWEYHELGEKSPYSVYSSNALKK